MKKENNKFKEILYWASEKIDTGFTRNDIQKKFNLDNKQLEYQLAPLMPASYNDRLIGSINISGKQNILTITAKGMSKYYELKNSEKLWYEKPLGLIFIGILIGVSVTILGDYLLRFIK